METKNKNPKKQTESLPEVNSFGFWFYEKNKKKEKTKKKQLGLGNHAQSQA